MINPSPLEVVREGYARYERGDFPGVFELLSPDIEINQTTDLPWGGHYKGRDGASAFFTALNKHTAAMPRPLHYIPAGEDVAVIGRLMGIAKGTSNPIDLDIVHIWTVRRGLIVRFIAYIDTPQMLSLLNLNS